jgi:hypothetical protein
MGNFVVKKTIDGDYSFNLITDDLQVILTSQIYSSKTDCLNGIEAVRQNCSDHNRYEHKQAASRKQFFTLNSTEGHLIATSPIYDTNVGLDNGIESVSKNGRSTTVVEEEPYF